jgi:predicted Zn-dependent protease
VSKGQVLGAQGNSEAIGGFPSWVGRLRVTGSDGAEHVLDAAFLRKSDTQMFEVLGSTAQAGDANEGRIYSSARSFRALTDPARLAVTPDRVHVVTVSNPGTFEEVVGRLGTLAISAEDASILNNRDPAETVRKGEVLKVVQPGKR